MLLSKPAIERCMAEGLIRISPYEPRNLGSASYDVTLGEHFYREKQIEFPPLGIPVYNPMSQRDVLRLWQYGKATPHDELAELLRWPSLLEGVGRGESIILLNPGETILGHTQEFIGGMSKIDTMLKARSTMGRNHITVCRDAGMGDIGYFNRWTLEITNNSKYHTIPLVVGRRVAQMLFFEVEPIESADSYERAGKYQSTADMLSMEAHWRPDAMLPKQYRDRESIAALVPLSSTR